MNWQNSTCTKTIKTLQSHLFFAEDALKEDSGLFAHVGKWMI
jgi:hypothetical protein